MHVFMETERLRLRRFTPVDLDFLVDLDADPAVTRFITGGRPTTRDEAQDRLTRYLSYYEQYEGFGFWLAELKASGDALGWFHFRPLPDMPPGEVELGYRLRRAAWGLGYATEGARAIIEAGFARYGVRRVVASTMSVNTGSRRVMAKCGLRYIRTFHQEWPDRIEGDEHGDVEYALTREQWLADRAERNADRG